VAQAASSSTTSSSGPSGSQRYVPGAYAPPSVPSTSTAANAFPVLQPTIQPTGPTIQPGRGTPSGVPKTAWSASAGSSSSTPAPRAAVPFSVPGPGLSSIASGKKKSGAPNLNSSAFPGLPSSGANQRAKVQASGNQSLRNIIGEPAPVANPWTPGQGGASSNSPAPNGTGNSGEAPGGGKKKKGKGKQTLFTMGSIPS
jgi:hypothetical protein